jgi:urease alpha subunit
VAVQKCRDIGKKDMKLNDATPEISVDPETYEVVVDGELIDMIPSTHLPLTQAHYLF